MTETTSPDKAGEGEQSRLVAKWVVEINLYEREALRWKERGRKILKRYKDERSSREERATRFNVLWSNVQTLLPALYARNPKPDVTRRFNDADPVGRVAADVLERTIAFFVNRDLFGQTMRQGVTDFLLPGRGTTWVRYVPYKRPIEGYQPPAAEEGREVTDDTGDIPEEVYYEETVPDYVHWEDFGHTVARTWEEVRAVWRRVYMTRDELVERFGDAAKTVPLDYKPKGLDGRTVDDGQQKASIYELWDKGKKCVIWLHKEHPEALDEQDDILGLDDFWPCPRPLFANLANDSMIATPDFVLYQDQANQLDDLTSRIAMITKALKVAGVYDKSAEGVSRVLAEGVENQLIPVDSWAAFAEKGGMKGTIDLLPLKDIADALVSIHQARDKVKQDLYEITGMADIIRGNSDPNETATAQQIKGQFATLRLGDRQAEVQRYARDTIRIMGEIIARHFSIDTIKKISGVRLFTAEEKAMYSPRPPMMQGGPPQPPMMPPPGDLRPDEFEDIMSQPTWEQVEQLLRDEPGRSFRLDIETDSTIKSDQEAEKTQRIQFLQAAGGFLQQAVQAGQSEPQMVPLLAQMMMFGIRAFPVGKELEQAFSTMLGKLEKQVAQTGGQPKPNPEMMKVQAEQQLGQARLQMEQQKAQSEHQLEQQRIQGDMQIAQAKVQADMQLAREKAQLDAQVAQAQQAAQAQQTREQQAGELQLEREKAAMAQQTEIQVAHIRAAAQIEAARITAAMSDGAQAEDREASGE